MSKNSILTRTPFLSPGPGPSWGHQFTWNNLYKFRLHLGLPKPYSRVRLVRKGPRYWVPCLRGEKWKMHQYLEVLLDYFWCVGRRGFRRCLQMLSLSLNVRPSSTWKKLSRSLGRQRTTLLSGHQAQDVWDFGTVVWGVRTGRVSQDVWSTVCLEGTGREVWTNKGRCRL